MAKNFKLLFSDMDGTLLTGKNEVSSYNIRAIEKAREKGAIFCIASGRPFWEISYIVSQTKTQLSPVVACNGAHVYLPETDEFLEYKNVPIEEGLKFLKFCDENNLIWSIYGHNCLCGPQYPTVFDMVFGDGTESSSHYLDMYNLPHPIRKVVKTDEEYIEALKLGAGKITVVNTDGKIGLVDDYFKTERPGVVCKQTGDPIREIMAAGTSKWGGIKLIADRLGIPYDEICVFGDNMNDLDMVENCDNSFVVSDGDKRIFPYATEIIRNHDDDAVGHAIEDYILDYIAE